MDHKIEKAERTHNECDLRRITMWVTIFLNIGWICYLVFIYYTVCTMSDIDPDRWCRRSAYVVHKDCECGFSFYPPSLYPNLCHVNEVLRTSFGWEGYFLVNVIVIPFLTIGMGVVGVLTYTEKRFDDYPSTRLLLKLSSVIGSISLGIGLYTPVWGISSPVWGVSWEWHIIHVIFVMFGGGICYIGIFILSACYIYVISAKSELERSLNKFRAVLVLFCMTSAALFFLRCCPLPKGDIFSVILYITSSQMVP